MSRPAIECDAVWKSYRIYHQQSHSLKERIITRRNSYDEFWAVQDVSFEVPAGSTLGIIGSNGSGKSTMLKTMARILTPNRGTVRVNGTMSSLLELGTGFHPELTGEENVYLAGSLMGQNSRAMKAKYDEIVDFAGVEQFMDLPVKNYSSGMYARLAFAVAISVDPQILLIDEVLSVGDEQFQERCYERIARFRAEGRTIVLVSHSLESVRSLCADALWLEKGVLRSSGSSADVVAEYLADVREQTEAHGGKTNEERWGTREIEITSVEVRPVGGAPAVMTGEPIEIAINYRKNADLPGDDVVCGIGLYKSDPLTYVYSQNTRQAGQAIDLTAKEGTITVGIPSLPLLPDSYTLTVLLEDVGGHHIYDRHERRYSFMVFNNPTIPGGGDGLVNIDTRWAVRSLQGSKGGG